MILKLGQMKKTDRDEMKKRLPMILKQRLIDEKKAANDPQTGTDR